MAAVLVKNLSDGSARIDMTLQKNDSTYKKAVVTLGTTILDTNILGYTKSFLSTEILVGQNYTLNIHDSTSLNINLIITMPGSYTDSVAVPANRIYSGGNVTVGWTVAANADGYILATVPPADAITDAGDSTYYYDVTSGTIIGPEIFRPNGVAVSGTHKVYVAAFAGAPVKTPGIPFSVPETNKPGDNVSKNILFGRLAGMVITAPDSVVVP